MATIKKRFLFLLLLSVSNFFAQSSKDKTIYLDSLRNISSVENYYYTRTITDYYGNSDSFKVKEYYKSGQLAMEGNLKDKPAFNQDGEFIYYYKNGNKKLVTNYKKSVEIGKYDSWYENGNKKIDGEFLKNKKNPMYRGDLKVNQFWNSENIQKVINGNGFYEEKFTKNLERGKFKKGLKDSIWSGIDKKCGIEYTETYKNGNLISGTSVASDKRIYHYSDIFLGPESKKGRNDFNEYVATNIRISNPSISGKIIIVFNVNADGSVSDLIILKGLDRKIDQQTKILVAEYEEWKPATYRGLAVDATLKLPINIQGNSGGED